MVTTTKKSTWNKDVEVGQREAFTHRNLMKIIKRQLSESAFRDAAIFMIAIDTLTGVKELSALRKRDVFDRTGIVRNIVTISGRKAVLSIATMVLLRKHFNDLKPGDFLFSSINGDGRAHISPRQISRIVKNWCKKIGIDDTNYGTESLRRTGAIFFYERTRDLNAIRILLNHSRITSTSAYLGIEDRTKGIEDRTKDIDSILEKKAVNEIFNDIMERIS